MNKLAELFRVGWSLQVVPDASPFGVMSVTVVWSLQRSELDQTLDGPVASLPIVQRVNVGDFCECVDSFYARVFPVSPLGDIFDSSDQGDIPDAER